MSPNFHFAVARGCPLFQKLCKFSIFYLALVFSGRDHSELDILRKDDGDAYSNMD